VAYEMQHNISTPKAYKCTPARITKESISIDSERVGALWADTERRIHNVG